MATFGYSSIGASSTANYGNSQAGGIYSLSANGSVSKITAYVAGGYSDQFAKAVIYSVVGGVPTGLKAISNTVAVPNPAWVDFTFPSPVNLLAGDYYLGIHTLYSVSHQYFIYYTASTGSGFTATDTYSDGPNDPLVGSANTNNYSIYATYTANANLPLSSPGNKYRNVTVGNGMSRSEGAT